MFWRLNLILITILLHPAIGQSNTISKSEIKSPGKTYALVIGISSYQNTSIPQLQFADKDASLFADYIASNIADSLRSERIKLLVNQDASIAAVYNALDWLKNVCSENDTAYIYFSGHGDIETKAKKSQGFLLAYNSPPNNYQNNAISIDDLNEIANILTLEKHAYVVLITDACHSGKLAGDFYKGKQWANEQLQKVLNDQVRLASCKTDQLANEGVHWGQGRGVFSYYLLNGLKGAADSDSSGAVQIKEIRNFLNISFDQDELLDNLKKQDPESEQNPVIDGHPDFELPLYKTEIIRDINPRSQIANTPKGLQAFGELKPQAINLFFQHLSKLDLEKNINFDSYHNLSPQDFALEFIDDLSFNYKIEDADTLRAQLIKNDYLQKRFILEFIEFTHRKIQDMINAYLRGDIAELKSRDYYNEGGGKYTNLLAMLNLAQKLISPDNKLAQVLEVNYYYLKGLTSRLNMAVSYDMNQLLDEAFLYQKKAAEKEPYAAYISNELGNLYLFKDQEKQADYYFKLAIELAPKWAIPWINSTRLNLQINDLKAAKEAIQMADSLQPEWKFQQFATGMLYEKEGNLLAAESQYLQALENNKEHYLPYEKLAYLYLKTGRYQEAEEYFKNAELLSVGFNVNPNYFKKEIARTFPATLAHTRKNYICPDSIIEIKIKTFPEFELIKALRLLDSSELKRTEGVKLLKQTIQDFPHLPLSLHYLGKEYFKNGNWKEAENIYKTLINEGKWKGDFLFQLVDNKDIATDLIFDSTFTNSLLPFQYDIIEDYYLLLAIYEEKDTTSAFVLYDEILNLIQNNKNSNIEFRERKRSDNIEIAYKLSSFYKKLNKYEQAENILLDRYAFETKDDFLPDDPDETNISNPFANIFETVIRKFYHQMTTLYPRNYYWKQKAGLFEHNILLPFFDKKDARNYEEISRYIRNNSQHIIDFKPAYQITIPGTNESFTVIDSTVKKFNLILELLEESVKLSPDLASPKNVQKAIPDLYIWQGNFDPAINIYYDLLDRYPDDSLIRNQLIRVLKASSKFPQVLVELETLRDQNQITKTQNFELIKYLILSKKYALASQLLRSIEPQTITEKKEIRSQYVLMNNLRGKPNKALKLLLAQQKKSQGDLEMTYLSDVIKSEAELYNLARIYAKKKKFEKAKEYLENAMDNSLDVKNILKNDKVWDKYRNSEAWEELTRKSQNILMKAIEQE